MRIVLLVSLTIIANSASQIFLKHGMTDVDRIAGMGKPLSYLFSLMTNFNVFFGVILLVLGLAAWLAVLAGAELSFAYPLLSSGYIVTAILSRIFLGEQLSLKRLIGILVICIGVAIVSNSK